jgi:hypothetical protein
MNHFLNTKKYVGVVINFFLPSRKKFIHAFNKIN